MQRFRLYSTDLSLLYGCLGLMFVAGCGGPRQAVLGPADGVVKINGEPAADILVQFLPVVEEGEPAPTSTAVTDEHGAFEMVTNDGKPGAVVGKCKVLFVDTTEERPPQGVALTRPPRISSSLAVINPMTREVEVKEEENAKFEFNLTD